MNRLERAMEIGVLSEVQDLLASEHVLDKLWLDGSRQKPPKMVKLDKTIVTAGSPESDKTMKGEAKSPDIPVFSPFLSMFTSLLKAQLPCSLYESDSPMVHSYSGSKPMLAIHCSKSFESLNTLDCVVMDAESEMILIEEHAILLEPFKEMLFKLMGSSTILVGWNACSLSRLLQLGHQNWLSLQNLFTISESSKNKERHDCCLLLKDTLSYFWQVQQFIFKTSEKDLVISSDKFNSYRDCCDVIKACKTIFRNFQLKDFPMEIYLPRLPCTLYVKGLRGDLEISKIFQSFAMNIIFSEDVRSRHFFNSKVHKNYFVLFPSRDERNSFFLKLPRLPEVFLSWKFSEAGNSLTVERIREISSSFGTVISISPIKIQAKNKFFSFITFLKEADARNFCGKREISENEFLFARMAETGSEKFRDVLIRMPIGQVDDNDDDKSFLEIFKL